MRRTLYLHIGSHRTATTSIQHFMHSNFQALLKRGYFYPYKVARHIKLMNALFSGKQTIDEAAADLTARADGWGDINAIVLSDEDISVRPDPGLLAAFRDHFDVKVVFSMRRQDLWLESWYFQNIKWQWNPLLSHCTFEDFLTHREEFHWIHYERYVARLEDLFGAENVLLSVFEKQQMPDGPVMEFCRQIGLDDTAGFSDAPHINSSMSAEMVEFIRHLPLHSFQPPERDLLRVALEEVDRDHLKNTGKQSERMMPHDLRRTVLQIYEDGNQTLAARRFGRPALFLDPLPDPDTALAQVTLPTDPAEVLNRFVGPLLSQLVENQTISGKNQHA